MAEPTAPVRTYEDLVNRLGPATDEDLRQHFLGIHDAIPVEWGKQVATPRIAKNALHILCDAYSFLSSATDEQLELLAAVNDETLKLATSAVLRARELYDSRRQQLTGSHEQTAKLHDASDQGREQAVSQRNVLHGVLTKIIKGVEPWQGRLEAAYSKAEDDASLAATMEKMVQEGRTLLKEKKDAGIVARRRTTRLSASWLDKMAAVGAERQRHAAEPVGVNPAPGISPADVDLRDGWALMLLDDIATAFDHAHDADPTVPRIDVRGLRSALRPRSGKAAQPPQVEPAQDQAPLT